MNPTTNLLGFCLVALAIGQPPEAEPEPKLPDPEETVEARYHNIDIKYLRKIFHIWNCLQVISEEPFTKNFRVTDEVKNSFDKEGFFILRSLFSNEEVHDIITFFVINVNFWSWTLEQCALGGKTAPLLQLEWGNQQTCFWPRKWWWWWRWS